MEIIDLGLPLGSLTTTTVGYLSDNRASCFLYSSVKQWPILISFGMQHRKETTYGKRRVGLALPSSC